mgnify:CR=1 FL=1
MKLKWFLIIIFLIILIGIIIIFFLSPRVCFKNQCFNVEIAKTPFERELGLMYRKSLDRDKGMLFIYPKTGEYSFWMKNTLIPLDIIWINENQQILYISKNTQPCQKECLSISPLADAKYVLEINAGMSDELGIRVGDNLTFKGVKIKNFLVK